MDRDRIERRDFSTARRGYDPGEVAEHLHRVADEFERLERERRSTEGLGGAAAEQIRTIVDAAERSAAEIRERADAESAEQVERVQRATDRLLEQTSAAESELERLLEALRSEAGSLVDGLRSNVESVRAELGEIRDALPALGEGPGRSGPVGAAAATAGETSTLEPDAATPEPDVEVAGEEDEELPAGEAPDEFAVDESEPAAQREADAAETPATVTDAVEEPPGRGEEPPRAIAGSEGARLIALNMALNGTPREETARYLSENFTIEDQETVLDEVYARAGA